MTLFNLNKSQIRELRPGGLKLMNSYSQTRSRAEVLLLLDGGKPEGWFRTFGPLTDPVEQIYRIHEEIHTSSEP